MITAGADSARIGKRSGWAVVTLVDGAFESVTFEQSLVPTLEKVKLLAIDIPIALPGEEGVAMIGQSRAADVEARSFLRPHSASVFPTPTRAALRAPDIVAARQIQPSLSAQSYGLRRKILEVDRIATAGFRGVEFHPEVSFRSLHGAPLGFSKKSWNGAALRRQILAAHGVVLPETLSVEAGCIAVDDVLDAAVGALTASWALEGRGRGFGSDSLSLETRGVIWAPRP